MHVSQGWSEKAVKGMVLVVLMCACVWPITSKHVIVISGRCKCPGYCVASSRSRRCRSRCFESSIGGKLRSKAGTDPSLRLVIKGSNHSVSQNSASCLEPCLRMSLWYDWDLYSGKLTFDTVNGFSTDIFFHFQEAPEDATVQIQTRKCQCCGLESPERSSGA